MADDSINLEYKIEEINTKLNDQHDTIILTEIVNFCGQKDLLEYKVSVDTLREALNFYFEYKDRQKGKWIDYQILNSGFSKCSQCNAEFDWDDNCRMDKWNFCPHCGAEMEVVAKNATTTEEEETFGDI